MSTDTAFALGMLALIGPAFPDRLRGFMLTAIVVDDLVALLVIAFAYSGAIDVAALAVAVAVFTLMLGLRFAGLREGIIYSPPCAHRLGRAL